MGSEIGPNHQYISYWFTGFLAPSQNPRGGWPWDFWWQNPQALGLIESWDFHGDFWDSQKTTKKHTLHSKPIASMYSTVYLPTWMVDDPWDERYIYRSMDGWWWLIFILYSWIGKYTIPLVPWIDSRHGIYHTPGSQPPFKKMVVPFGRWAKSPRKKKGETRKRKPD